MRCRGAVALASSLAPSRSLRTATSSFPSPPPLSLRRLQPSAFVGAPQQPPSPLAIAPFQARTLGSSPCALMSEAVDTSSASGAGASSAAAAAAACHAERTMACSDGITLSAQCWSPPSSTNAATGTAMSKRRILCLHGWLDNSATFHLLAPALFDRLNNIADDGNRSTQQQQQQQQQQPTEIVALDLPGHGMSSHKSQDSPQLLADYCFYVNEVLEELGWAHGGEKENGEEKEDEGSKGKKEREAKEEGNGNGKVILIGHSMGAGIATTFASAFPHLIDSIILLEGAGPLARRGDDAARHIRHAVERRRRGNQSIYGSHGEGGGNCPGDGVSDLGAGTSSGGGKKGVRIYPNINAATDVRVSTARLAPGKQYLSREAARALVERATVPYTSTAAAVAALSAARASGTNVEGFTDESVVFRHDPRLQWPSLQYFTREQVDAIYSGVKCPVCLLAADDGWPFGERERSSVKELLRPRHYKKLPGSHHFHADPDSFGAVFDEVCKFLER